MRFKEFLNEASGALERQELVELVRANCKDYLKEHKRGQYFYRGMKSFGRWGVKTVRKDRKALNSSNIQESILNLLNISHKKPTRNTLVFTTSIVGQAEYYGTPYIIIPAGKYSYFLYPNIQDTSVELMYYEQDLEKIIGRGFHDDKNLEKALGKMKHINEFTDYVYHLSRGLDKSARRKVADLNKRFFNIIKTVDENKVPNNFKGEINFICDKYYCLEDTPDNRSLLESLADEV